MWIRLIPLSLPDRRPIKYPYIQTCTDEMVCSKMETLTALVGQPSRNKKHMPLSSSAVIEIMSFRC